MREADGAEREGSCEKLMEQSEKALAEVLETLKQRKEAGEN